MSKKLISKLEEARRLLDQARDIIFSTEQDILKLPYADECSIDDVFERIRAGIGDVVWELEFVEDFLKDEACW